MAIVSNYRIVTAEDNANFCNSREDFSLAVSKKSSIINVNNIDFGDNAISIEINYSCTIVGNMSRFKTRIL